jgi:hypothetical protein
MTIEIPEGIPTIIFDYFHQGEIPTFVLCNPNKEQLYALGGISERTYSAKFNAFSELSFRADEYVNEIYMEYYDYLTYRRLIYVDTIGYFMINEVNQMSDGIVRYKEVKAQALEVELSSKRLVVFQSGSTVMVSGSPVPPPNPVKLNDLLLDLEDEWIPNWTHNGVPGMATPPPVGGGGGASSDLDTGIASKYRSFDISDKTVYDFLMTEVEDAYECVFDFDTVNQIINIYDPNVAIAETDIYISHNNVINELSVDEVVDELATCLNVHGGGGMDIRWVNPLGNNNIYDLSYFETTDWMAQTLIDKLNVWESKIESASPIYSASAQVLIEWYDYISASTAIFENKSASMAYLVEARKDAIEMPGTTGSQLVADLTVRIDALQIEINTIDAKITTGCGVVADVSGSMNDLSDTLSFEETFSATQISQLQPFIIESSYVNANIILTDSMSASNVIIYADQLYNSASAVLDKTSHPRYTFEVDSVNFMQIEEFQMFRDQLCLGAVITIEISDGQNIEAILLGMDINFDDPTDFTLTFGNRLRMDDESLKFTDLMGKAITAGNNNRLYSQQWNNWTNNYKNNVSSFITSPINGAVNTIINSGSKTEITIATDGIRARKKEPVAQSYEGTGYSGSQIYITANSIAVTMDNWKTYSKIVGGSVNYYGLIAHLDDLLDVDATNPNDGDTILYDSATGSWVHGPGGGGDSCFVCDDTNTYGGDGALTSHSTGINNTAIGYAALHDTNSGDNNVALGYGTLYSNQSGGSNVGIGFDALYYNNGNENIAIGTNALYTNTTGGCNVAIGARAMGAANIGNDSVAIGRGALYYNKASYNIGIGYHALFSDTSGSKNVAIGYNALTSLTLGEQNTAVGWEALAHSTTSEGNTAVGGSALHKTTYGDFNTAVGIGAMEENTTGYSNVAVGDYALRRNIGGDTNVAIGEAAMGDNTEGSDNVAIGGGALSTITEYSDYNVAIGDRPMAYAEEGSDNIAIGSQALYYNAGDGNIAIGRQAMVNSSTGSYNIAIGVGTMYSTNNSYYNIGIGFQALYNNLGHYNIAIGGSAMEHNTTGQYNVAIGTKASKYNEIGEANVAIGWDSLRNNETSWNTAVGFATIVDNVTGIENTAVGAGALLSTLASWNTAVGAWALNLNSSGSYNTALGAYALEYNEGGEKNIAIGYQAMDKNVSGDDNVAIGFQSSFSNIVGGQNTAAGNYSLFYNTHGDLNVAIGDQAMYYNITGQMNTALGQTSLHDNQWGEENVAIGLGALERMDANGGAILAFSDYSGIIAGAVRVTTDGGHGLPTGTTTEIDIKGTNNYNHSSITVTRIDATHFYFTHSWLGDDATGYWFHGHSGYMNTAVGAESGYNTGSGAYNVFIGAKADSTVNTNNSIAIGHEAYVTKSNQIMLGNGDITETVLNGHVILANTDWDDLRVPITNVKLAGIKDPGFAVFKTNGAGSTGVYTYWFDKDTEEEVFFSCQMPHNWKEGTDIHPHVHWTPKTDGTTSASRVCWGLEYTWSNITGSFGNTSISYANLPISYTGSPIADAHYLTELPDISGAGKTFSSMLICRLFRDATSSGSSDSYGYDAGLLEFDFHYEIDSFGSQDEFVK